MQNVAWFLSRWHNRMFSKTIDAGISPNNMHSTLSVKKIFVILSFALILIGWFALVFTLAGIFYKAILIPLIVLTFASAAFFIAKHKTFERPSRADIFALAIVLFFAIFNTVYFHDTFFGGRDDGLYTNHGIYLAQNHDLIFDGYHDMPLPGMAKVDDHFTTERYPGYISWTALHCTFLGTFGIRVSNFLLIIIGFVSLYLIGKKLKSSKVGIATVLMFATTFPMLWFTRRTYSEILLLALIWFGILCFLEAYEKKQPNYLVPMFFAFGLAFATRAEATPIFLMLVLILIFLLLRQKREIFSKKLGFFILIAIAPFIYWSVATPMGQFWAQVVISFTSAPASVVAQAVPTEGSTLGSNYPSFVFDMFSKYNLQWQFLFIPLALLGSFLRKDKELFKYLLIIFVMIMPAFAYLINPHISIDQPWFLRRYIPTIFPFAFLCTAILLFELVKNKRLLASIIATIIVMNLAVASPILIFKENDGMVNNVENLSNHFSDEDLILVDTLSSPTWYNIADPLFFVFGKHTLWLNGDSSDLSLWGFPMGYYDIKSVVDFSEYRKVYIVTRSDMRMRYSVIANGDATLVFEQDMTNRFLMRTVSIIHLPDRPPNQDDIEYDRIEPLIERPTEIVTRHYHMEVYEVKK